MCVNGQFCHWKILYDVCVFSWNQHDAWSLPACVSMLNFCSGKMVETMLCNSTPALCGHLNASCFFCVFECLVCWVTSTGFQQACHSDCLSWGRDLCESCFSSSLLSLSADGDPHPRWPTHQNKRDRGSWFSDKHHSLSLLSEGQGARRFISRGSPPAIAFHRPTAPSHRSC